MSKAAKPAKPAKLTKRTEKRAEGGALASSAGRPVELTAPVRPAARSSECRRGPHVKDCTGNAVSTGGLDPAWYPLWEAADQPGPEGHHLRGINNDREDDTYGSSTIPDTKGTMTVTGAAEFYEGLTPPASFTVTNAAPTWILPATKTAPTLMGGTGTIPHSLTATWDCCRKKGKKKKTKVQTT